MKVMLRLLATISLVAILLRMGWKQQIAATLRLLPQNSVVAETTSHLLTQGTYYEVAIPPEKADWYSSADYRLWLPNGVNALRGLIVMQHGCGDGAEASGLDHANDLQWQALAAKHQFALLGSKVTAGDRPCEFWSFSDTGTPAAFLKALHRLGRNSGHSELETVPWVLKGHSSGAEWVTGMMKKYPGRTLAVVAIRGGGYLLIGSDPSTLKVPVLFAVGLDDPYPQEAVEMPRQVFLRQRQQGALWSFASAPNTAHEVGETRSLAIPYLDAIISERLNLETGELNPIVASTGWLGNLATHAVAAAKDYPGDAEAAVWLPNQIVAYKWQEYVGKGKILPTSLPAEPTAVRALKYPAIGTVITWQYSPDLENGLPAFRIYRNRSLIATVSGQSHNFGDAPEPANVVLEFVDQNGQDHSAYTVAAFNSLGETASRSVSYSAQSVNGNPVNDK